MREDATVFQTNLNRSKISPGHMMDGWHLYAT